MNLESFLEGQYECVNMSLQLHWNIFKENTTFLTMWNYEKSPLILPVKQRCILIKIGLGLDKNIKD